MQTTNQYRNIFTAIATLKELRKEAVDESRLLIIRKLLDEHGSLSLTKQVKSPNASELREIYNTIKLEIKTGNYEDEFEKALGAVAKDLKKVIYHMNLLRYAGDERTTSRARKKEYARLKTFYTQTQTLYQGQVVLPLDQYLDVHFGESDGYCLGYTFEWMLALTQNQMPFGIDPLNPIKHTFPDGDFNLTNLYERQRQLAPLNKSIVKLSLLQNLGLEGMAIHGRYDGYLSSEDHLSFQDHWVSTLRWISTEKSMAHFLASTAKTHPLQTFSVVLQLQKGGHILSLYRDNLNNYHFFDANYGWFRFESSQQFESWLSYYLEVTKVVKNCQYHYLLAHTVMTVQNEKSISDRLRESMTAMYDQLEFRINRYLLKWPNLLVKKIVTLINKKPTSKQATTLSIESNPPCSPLVSALVDLPDERINNAKSALEKNPFHPGLFRRTTHDQSREPNPDRADHSAQRAFRV